MISGITGAHVLLYSDNPEADRAFFRDVLRFGSVDAGGGWLIFALPPTEAGIHPSDGEKRSQVHGGRQLLGSVPLPHVRRPASAHEISQGKGSELFTSRRGRLGNQDYVPVAERWRNWSLSAQASNSPRP